MVLYQRFLCAYANYHYSQWKAARKKPISNRDNPYRLGYSQPEWMSLIRKAIGEENEEMAKAVFMAESQYDPKMLEIRGAVSFFFASSSGEGPLDPGRERHTNCKRSAIVCSSAPVKSVKRII